MNVKLYYPAVFRVFPSFETHLSCSVPALAHPLFAVARSQVLPPIEFLLYHAGHIDSTWERRERNKGPILI
jgi:hypothetical protein